MGMFTEVPGSTPGWEAAWLHSIAAFIASSLVCEWMLRRVADDPYPIVSIEPWTSDRWTFGAGATLSRHGLLILSLEGMS